MEKSRDIARLIEIMAALRTPETGCPWDLEQTFATIAPYTIEEAYEVAHAISLGDLDELRDELGDLLLQVVFHARMAEEKGAFDFGGVVEAITDKLIRRHPHVFGDARDLTPDEVSALWGKIKAQEKREKAARKGDATALPGALSQVKAGLPALARALELQKAAGKVGFDWNDIHAVLDKIEEESREVADAVKAGDRAHVEEEIGDLFFVMVNLARHAGVDPETALRAANAKFETRFGYVESELSKRGSAPQDANLAEMDALWNEAKKTRRI
ncbi:MAG: nucleoside triphosphate pyrophosphohydrolase [Hyphomicrobiales bacterium]|nr:nucleoside triphosphate pyrophosphohydrolase [Hyphomicrobiales bacterium]